MLRPWLAVWVQTAATAVVTYNVGTTVIPGTVSYENLRYAVDRWNTEYTAHTEVALRLTSPTHAGAFEERWSTHPSNSSSISSVGVRFNWSNFLLNGEEARLMLVGTRNKGEVTVCEVLQHGVVAFVLAPGLSPLDDSLVRSMCHHFQIPCLSIQSKNEKDVVSDFVSFVGPSRGLAALATSQFLDSLRWTSFLLAYQHDSELSPLMYARSEGDHVQRRPSIRVRRLPKNTRDFEPFLKYIRTRLKQTNIIIHSNNITTLYNLLQQARGLNMTEAPYSYIFTHTDLSLLEDFLNNMQGQFHCNITGLQLVKNDPMMKTELALTSESTTIIGTALHRLQEIGTAPRPASLLCDAKDAWRDGRTLNQAIRRLNLKRQLTGDISFDENGAREDLSFYGIGRINSQFVKLGNWSQRRSWIYDDKYANKWEFDIPEDAETLEGLHLRIVVYLEEPFVMKRGDNYEGFCIDLLNEMAAILKFNYTIIEIQDGTYGIEDESGRWNGIIGVLQRHEADLSISAVTITYSRVEVVDFTLPFMHLGISILIASSREDQEKGSLFTFLEPLSLNVWLSLIAAYLSVSFTMYLLARFSPYEWYEIEKIDERDRSVDDQKNQFSVLNSLWFAVGSLMQQGSDVIPRAAATRVVAVIWWMFTQILISSYTANLAAFLTVERMSTPIESTADLAGQQRIKYGTLKSGSTMDFFREKYKAIRWSVMESSSPTVFVNSSKEGIARVKAGNYAYLMESSMLEYYMERDCQLQSIGGLLDSKGYGIALPKGSPLRDILSQTVLQLQERTILEALKNKWWKDLRDGPSCKAPTESANSHVSNVFGIFYVLATGLLIAVLMAAGEYCIEARHDSFRLRLTVLGKIVDWWNGVSDSDESRKKARSKLRNLQLDTAGQELPNHEPASPDEIPTRLRVRGSSAEFAPISRESFRRLSRMIPAGDEALRHLQRLKDTRPS